MKRYKRQWSGYHQILRNYVENTYSMKRYKRQWSRYHQILRNYVENSGERHKYLQACKSTTEAGGSQFTP
jgi:hypothetical protein